MSKVRIFFGSLFVFSIAFLIFFIKNFFSKNLKHQSKKRILLIRTDAIGDFVLWRPFGISLYEHYVNLGFSVDYLVSETIASSVLIEGLASNIIIFDKKKFQSNITYTTNLIKSLRRYKYTVVLAPQYSRFIGASIYLLLFISRSPNKIGIIAYQSRSTIIQMIRSILDYLILNNIKGSNEKVQHEILRNSSFLKSVGVNHQYLTNQVTIKDGKWNSFLRKPYVIIFPGGSIDDKCWPASKFNATAKFLNEKGILVVVCGSKDDVPRAQGITFSDSVLNYLGKGNLDFFIRLLKNASFIVTNDTMAVHLAAMCKIKSLALMWGAGGDHGRFLPYPIEMQGCYQIPSVEFKSYACDPACRGACKHLNCNLRARCINEISVQDVTKIISTELDLD